MLKNIMLEEAQELILNNIVPLPGQLIPLTEAVGRVCCQDVWAGHDLPPCRESVVDGYAVSFSDCVSEKYQLKASLQPGERPEFTIEPGQAAGVVTGGLVPQGTRAVVPLEFTEVKDGFVTVNKNIKPGDNLKAPGEDIRSGDKIAQRGIVLGPGLTGVLAVYGINEVKVFSRPKVAILSLGREIVPYQEMPAPGQKKDANGLILAALVQREGGQVLTLEIAGDAEPGRVSRRLEELLEQADVVLTTGSTALRGSGQAPDLIRQAGAQMLFWGVKIKSGSHSGAAKLSSKTIIALPGNPAACVVAYHLFAAPLLRALQGLDPRPVRIKAVAADDWNKKVKARRFARGYLFWDQDQWRVTFLPGQKSSMFRSLISYNALVDLSAGHPPVKKGEEVPVILLTSRSSWGYNWDIKVVNPEN